MNGTKAKAFINTMINHLIIVSISSSVLIFFGDNNWFVLTGPQLVFNSHICWVSSNLESKFFTLWSTSKWIIERKCYYFKEIVCSRCIFQVCKKLNISLIMKNLHTSAKKYIKLYDNQIQLNKTKCFQIPIKLNLNLTKQ